MAERKSRKEILDEVYGRAIERAVASGSRQIRSVQVTTAAREIPFAHVIGSPEDNIFSNLALDIGFHEDYHPEGSLGIFNITPPEAVIIAADLSVKSSSVEIGFMDRFKGTLIIIGSRGDVEQAMEDNLRFFHDQLNFNVCELSMK